MMATVPRLSQLEAMANSPMALRWNDGSGKRLPSVENPTSIAPMKLTIIRCGRPVSDQANRSSGTFASFRSREAGVVNLGEGRPLSISQYS
jgi:hypothetical protein